VQWHTRRPQFIDKKHKARFHAEARRAKWQEKNNELWRARKRYNVEARRIVAAMTLEHPDLFDKDGAFKRFITSKIARKLESEHRR